MRLLGTARTTGKRERMKREIFGTLTAFAYLIGWLTILLVLAHRSTPGVLALGMVFFGVNTVMLIRGR